MRISGGGRCNVTHACFEPRDLVLGYPRGGRELLGPFHVWQPRETAAWFADRGVRLKTEADGRMFPVTDLSATVVDCLLGAADRAGVRVRTRAGLLSAGRGGPAELAFLARLATGEILPCDRLLLATGGGRSSAGLAVAQSLGHAIEPPVPSLFTFHIDDHRLRGLEGLSVPDAAVAMPAKRLASRGPLLVTHGGLSGPAILKLSAWGARELAACDYRFEISVEWSAGLNAARARDELRTGRAAHPRKQVPSWNPFLLPRRLWERLVDAAGIPAETVWASISNEGMRALAAQLTACRFAVAGKSLNKEEFVTCGGVRLAEVDFKTMESKLVPGLHFAGEVLDIDGLTGGFNLQAAWTTGRIAGLALAR